MVGAVDGITRSVKEYCSTHKASFDDICTFLSDEAFEWFNENSEKLGEDEDELYSFIVVSPDMRKIDEKGYSEECYDFECDGSGIKYGLYILKNRYKEDITEEEAKELAVYTILETSKMDPSVGNDIQMAVFSREGECKIINKDEIEEIKMRLTPISMDAIKSQIENIEDIIKMREELNSLSKKVFGFKLLLQNESYFSNCKTL